MGRTHSKPKSFELICTQPNFELDLLECARSVFKNKEDLREYLILSPGIGRSSFCELREIYNPGTNQKHLLKTFNTTLLSINEREFLINQLQQLSQLNHTNILKVISIFDDSPNFVCAIYENFEGESVSNLLVSREKRMSSIDVFQILKQLLAVLDYLHGMGIRFDNFEPAEILFNGQTAKVYNFEFAVPSKEGQKRDVFAGDLRFKSPEELIGQGWSRKSDLWKLGVLGYQLLSGQHPFEGESKSGVAEAIIKNSPVMPVEHLLIGEEERDFLQQILVKDPEKRITTDQIEFHKFFSDKAIACQNRVNSLLNTILVNESYFGRKPEKLKNALLILFAIEMETRDGNSKEAKSLFKIIDKNGKGRITRADLHEATFESPELRLKVLKRFDDFRGNWQFLPWEIFWASSINCFANFSAENLRWFFESFELDDRGNLTNKGIIGKVEELDICVAKFIDLPEEEFVLSFEDFKKVLLDLD